MSKMLLIILGFTVFAFSQATFTVKDVIVGVDAWGNNYCGFKNQDGNGVGMQFPQWSDKQKIFYSTILFAKANNLPIKCFDTDQQGGANQSLKNFTGDVADQPYWWHWILNYKLGSQ